MAVRPCLGCGTPTTNGSRCVDCSRGFRRSRHNALYDTADWRKRRKSEIAAHVARHGWSCPGFGVPAHGSLDLTLDHVLPGSLARGTQVLCRGCNTRKRHHDSASRRR